MQGKIAQLVDPRHVNPEVSGSSPALVNFSQFPLVIKNNYFYLGGHFYSFTNQSIIFAVCYTQVYWTINDTNPVNITYSYYVNKNIAQRTTVDAALRLNPLSRPSGWFVKTPNQGISPPQSRYMGTVKTSMKSAAQPTEDLLTLQEPF